MCLASEVYAKALLSQVSCASVMITIFYHVVATVSFNQSMYNVGEGDGEIEVLLALSNPSSIDITIVITDYSYTALGK